MNEPLKINSLVTTARQKIAEASFCEDSLHAGCSLLYDHPDTRNNLPQWK